MPSRPEYKLILDHLALPARARVLVLYARAATPLLTLQELSAGGSVVGVAPQLPDYTQLQKDIGARAGAEITVVLENLLTPPAAGPFDCALLDTDGPAGRGNTYTFRLIDYMVDNVRPAGSIWLQGSNGRGLQTFVRRLTARCGEVSAVAVGGGKRSYRALRPEETAPLSNGDDATTSVPVETQGIRFQLTVQPGVFSGRKLDDATALLLGALRLTRSDDVLDLGCGAGAIGITAALLAPEGQTLLVDSSPLAVRLAEHNLTANGITNATALLSDAYSAVQGRHFDVIATNPPFHQHSKETRGVAERFVREAPDYLRPGGRFYVVANAFLPYQRTMERVFDTVETVASTPSYRVLCGFKGPTTEKA
ncbi:MAG TPA: class I SAM-dependent methyltransferase [Chloroflexota bacterium]